MAMAMAMAMGCHGITIQFLRDAQKVHCQALAKTRRQVLQLLATDATI